MGIRSGPGGFVSVSWAKLSSSYRSSALSSLCRTQHFDKKTFQIYIFFQQEERLCHMQVLLHIVESKGAQKQLFDVSITRQQPRCEFCFHGYCCWLYHPPSQLGRLLMSQQHLQTILFESHSMRIIIVIASSTEGSIYTSTLFALEYDERLCVIRHVCHHFDGHFGTHSQEKFSPPAILGR